MQWDSSVHIWAVDLDTGHGLLQQSSCILSLDERKRAGKMRCSRQRDRFVVCHCILRLLLAAYSDVPFSRVCFDRGRNGKPLLAGGERDLQFSLSRSGNLAVYGFARNLELGIDIESLSTSVDINLMAEHYFCTDEQAELANAVEVNRIEYFFACWTRKEAYLKATGEGIDDSLKCVRASLPRRPMQGTANFSKGISGPESWSWYTFHPAKGFIAAIAFRGFRTAYFSRRKTVYEVLENIASRQTLLRCTSQFSRVEHSGTYEQWKPAKAVVDVLGKKRRERFRL